MLRRVRIFVIETTTRQRRHGEEPLRRSNPVCLTILDWLRFIRRRFAPAHWLAMTFAATADGAHRHQSAMKLQPLDDLVDHLPLGPYRKPTRLRSARATALTASRLAAS